METQFEKLAIIDHDNHRLIIDDVDVEIIENTYRGEEEDYIRANYELGENWEWEWIVSTEHHTTKDKHKAEKEEAIARHHAWYAGITS